MRTERAGLSRRAAVAKVMDYMLKHWDGFVRFLDDGRICLTSNAAEIVMCPLQPKRAPVPSLMLGICQTHRGTGQVIFSATCGA